MKIIGNLDFVNNQSKNFVLELYDGSLDTTKPFPDNPTIGRVVFRIDLLQIFVCISTDPVYWKPIIKVSSGYIHTQSTVSSEWYITHNLKSEDLIVQTYNNSGYKIEPDNIQIVDENTIKITFNPSTTGKAVILSAEEVMEQSEVEVYTDSDADSTPYHNGQSSIKKAVLSVNGEDKHVLYVNNIFVHKDGNISETITGDKTFSNNITVSGTSNLSTTLPTQDSSFDLGSTTLKWANVYSNNFYGNMIQANNADLAEKYIYCGDLEVGDIVKVSTDTKCEIERCDEIAALNVIGVVSDKPGFILNQSSKGIPVALKGKVLCKVQGPIRKGEPIISYEQGAGISLYNVNTDLLNQPIKIIGVALEDIEDDEVRKILIII